MQEKKWLYEKRDGFFQLVFTGDHFKVEGRFGLLKRSVEEFFLYPSIQTTLALDVAVCQYLALHHTPSKDWEKPTLQRWHFWSSLQVDNVPTLEIDLTTRPLFPATFFLNSNGSYQQRTIGGGHVVTRQEQRLDQLFFEGPSSPNLPFALRQQIKEAIWNALQQQGLPFSYADGFPLMDYEKIAPKRWEINRGATGDYIALHQEGHAEIGGWSSATQGGSQKIALESLWGNPDYHLKNGLEKYKKEILGILQRTLIQK